MRSRGERASPASKRKLRVLVAVAIAAVSSFGLIIYYDYAMVPMRNADSSRVQGPLTAQESFHILSQAHTDVCAYLASPPGRQ
jgi:hypothetical protein